MEKINESIKIHVQIITFLVIWVGVLFVAGTISPFDPWTAIKQIPEAISIYAIVGIIFVRWVWRWHPLQNWLIKIPDLQGTWRGELRSDWVDPKTQKGIRPIPAMLVIKQNFSKIDCLLMTKESESYAVSANFNLAPNGDLYLAYSYTNRPKANLRGRSPMHDGAALVKVIRKPTLMLEGEYWTNRKTKGEMTLRFESRECAEQFN